MLDYCAQCGGKVFGIPKNRVGSGPVWCKECKDDKPKPEPKPLDLNDIRGWTEEECVDYFDNQPKGMLKYEHGWEDLGKYVEVRVINHELDINVCLRHKDKLTALRMACAAVAMGVEE